MNREAEGDEFADDLNANQARIAKLIVKPSEKNRFREKLAKQKDYTFVFATTSFLNIKTLIDQFEN
jgi:hypothetical protein